jgi:hypothetical protein
MRALLSCSRVDQLAVRFYFGSVPEGMQTSIRLHLAECPRCRQKLQQFDRVWRWDGQRRRQDGLSISENAATMSSLSAS